MLVEAVLSRVSGLQKWIHCLTDTCSVLPSQKRFLGLSASGDDVMTQFPPGGSSCRCEPLRRAALTCFIIQSWNNNVSFFFARSGRWAARFSCPTLRLTHTDQTSHVLLSLHMNNPSLIMILNFSAASGSASIPCVISCCPLIGRSAVLGCSWSHVLGHLSW